MPEPTTDGTPEGQQDGRTRVLFVSSNGAGVGHLMRLMAMARRASPAVEPLLLTMSQAVPVVDQAGYFVEYLMSSGYSGMPAHLWHRLLRARLGEIIRTHEVAALVFDGTWPYRGMLDAFEDHPHVRTAWSRRAMWKPDLDSPAPAASHRFDLIIEPGEFAEAIDRGQTIAHRDETTRVAPITFLDRSEMHDREAACDELGLDPDRPAALVQLGAGNINDTSSLLGAVVDRLSQEPHLQVCVTRSIIGASSGTAAHGAISLEGVYPLARYLHAFDMAVAASGYNTYHELLAGAVPSLFVPNLDTQADDQAARARYAEAAGVALAAEPPDVTGTLTALEDLLDPARREQLATRCRERVPGNGAADAMAAIEQLLGIGHGPRPGTPTGDLGEVPQAVASVPRPRHRPVATTEVGSTPRAVGALIASDNPTVRAMKKVFWALPAGVRRPIRRRLGLWQFGTGPLPGPRRRLPVPAGAQQGEPGAAAVAGLAVFLPEQLEPAEQADVLERLAELQASNDVAPLVVTFENDLAKIRQLGLPLELLPTCDAWSRLEESGSWEPYLRDRITHITQTWDVSGVVALGPIGNIDALEVAVLTTRPPRTRLAHLPPG